MVKKYYIFYPQARTLFFFLYLCPLSLYAQNNPYQINDECFRYIAQINKVMKSPQAQALCDTMIQVADKHQDVKGHCVALTLKALNYLNTNDDRVVSEFPVMKSYIEKTPYQQYLYAIWGYQNTYYEKQKKQQQAYEVLVEMKDYALAHNDQLGIISVYEALGSHYHGLRNYKQALYNYQQAYEIAFQMPGNKNIHVLERKIGICYSALSEIEQAIVWLKKSIQHSPEMFKLSTLLAYIPCAFKNPDYSNEERAKDISEAKRLYHQYPPQTKSASDNYHCILADYYSKIGERNQTIAHTDSILSPEKKIETKALAYRQLEMNDSAALYLSILVAQEREQWRSANSQIFAELTAANDSSALAIRAQRLQISQLKDREQLLLMQQQKNQLELENADLELANRQNLLLAEQHKSALALSESHANQLELQNQKDRNEGLLREHELDGRRQQLLSTFVATLLFGAVFIYWYMRKSNIRLKKEKAVSEKARHEEEKQRLLAVEAMDKAQKADKLKSLFLHNMSHEIRTPLNAIVGFNDVLNGEMGSELGEDERQEFLGLIKTNSHLLTTLINDILDLSKLESGTYNIELSSVDVDSICQASIRSVEGRNQAGVKLICTPYKRPIKLNTDASRLQQILTNFLTNACKNTDEGSITLGYCPVIVENQSYIRFSVTDTGCGVPKDKAESIFNRFEKLDKFKQGTGLGLSIVELISDLLHGRVYLDTEYTDGARFVFEHPIKEEDVFR